MKTKYAEINGNRRRERGRAALARHHRNKSCVQARGRARYKLGRSAQMTREKSPCSPWAVCFLRSVFSLVPGKSRVSTIATSSPSPPAPRTTQERCLASRRTPLATSPGFLGAANGVMVTACTGVKRGKHMSPDSSSQIQLYRLACPPLGTAAGVGWPITPTHAHYNEKAHTPWEGGSHRRARSRPRRCGSPSLARRRASGARPLGRPLLLPPLHHLPSWSVIWAC